MSYQQGPALAARPLHFFLVLDVSGSMGKHGKVEGLNQAIEDALPALVNAEAANPGVDLLLRAVAFAEDAWWHIAEPTPVAEVRWAHLDAVEKGTTETGRALDLVLEQLRGLADAATGLPPAIVLVSDGKPTDYHAPTYGAALRALAEDPWGARASRMSVGIGRDADLASLQRFIGHDEIEPLLAHNATELVHYVRWAATVLFDGATRLGAPEEVVAGSTPPPPPPPLTPRDLSAPTVAPEPAPPAPVSPPPPAAESSPEGETERPAAAMSAPGTVIPDDETTW